MPMPTITVNFECEACNGLGYVENPLYGQFNSEMLSWEQQNPRPIGLEGDNWNKRLWDVEKEWWISRGYGTWPQEDITCHQCNGTGKRVAELSVAEFTKMIIT